MWHVSVLKHHPVGAAKHDLRLLKSYVHETPLAFLVLIVYSIPFILGHISCSSSHACVNNAAAITMTTTRIAFIFIFYYITITEYVCILCVESIYQRVSSG